MNLIQNFLRVTQHRVGNHRESLLPQVVQRLGVGGKRPSLHQLQVEHRNVQLPLGTHLRILLPQGARRCISGIGQQGFPLQLQFLIDPIKYGSSHVHLSPYNEPGKLLRQVLWDKADRAQIPRYILSHPAIAASGSLVKLPVPILQSNRQAIHLWLHAVFCPGQRLQYLGQKALHLVPVEYILQALQGHRMPHLGKVVEHSVSHPLGR